LLSEKVKKRIKSQNWKKHTNKSQFLTRIKDQSASAFEDLTLLANKLEEKEIQEIFTKERFDKLISALLKTNEDSTKLKLSELEKDRIFVLGFTFINNSLSVTGRMIGDRYAEILYKERELALRKILRMLYDDKIKN